MNSVVIFSSAQSQVDVDKLFHANPPSLSPNRPVNAQIPQSNSNDQFNDETSENNENFQVFRGPRHDEFDWSLTKVSKFYEKVFKLTNKFTLILMKYFPESFR